MKSRIMTQLLPLLRLQRWKKMKSTDAELEESRNGGSGRGGRGGDLMAQLLQPLRRPLQRWKKMKIRSPIWMLKKATGKIWRRDGIF
jgi:hypothetical protein